MSQTITTTTDLDTYLQLGGTIDTTRATLLLDLAYDKCSSIINPVPASARGVMLEVAGRAYTNVSSAHQVSLGSGSVSFGGASGGPAIGGLYLSASNERELRRLAGGGGAFSIDPTPSGAGQNLPIWDQNATFIDGIPLLDDLAE